MNNNVNKINASNVVLNNQNMNTINPNLYTNNNNINKIDNVAVSMNSQNINSTVYPPQDATYVVFDSDNYFKQNTSNVREIQDNNQINNGVLSPLEEIAKKDN